MKADENEKSHSNAERLNRRLWANPMDLEVGERIEPTVPDLFERLWVRPMARADNAKHWQSPALGKAIDFPAF